MFASRRDKKISLPGGKTAYRDGRKEFVAYVEVRPDTSATSGFSVTWFKSEVYDLKYGAQLFTYPTKQDEPAFSVLALSAPSAKLLDDRIDEVTSLQTARANPAYSATQQEELRARVTEGGRLAVCAQREGGIS